jgi:dethiobiotin synthetase
MNKKADNIFVLGTDTGVGKTVLSLLLMQYFHAKGRTPFYLKPLQTGCIDPYDKDSDAAFVYRYFKPFNQKDPADSVIYCFKNPKAPYFAARDDGSDIDLKTIEKVVEKKKLSHNPLIVEGAGGLFVPVTEKTLMIDMIRMVDAGVILAARAGLGTINHTLLSIEALNRRNIQPAGVVFIDAGETPTSEDMIRENMESIEAFSGIKVAGVIKRIDNFSNPDPACYLPLKKIFSNNLAL